MAGTRTLKVEILGDAKGLGSAFATAEKSAGSFASSLGKAGLLAGAALGALGVGAVVGLAKVGESFDTAYDTIRTTTGATGEALEGLKDSFKAVATSVAGVNFEDASAAVAELAQRTGLAGKPLEELSAQFLNLSKVTGSDLSTNIGNITRVFGDWSISTDDQAEAMDKMLRASQATGAGIDGLSSQVVSFGAPLRQLGFSFDESLAMLGKWEKEGVNTELVLGGMKKALGNFAKEGKDAPAAFRELITTISDMKDPTLATQKAIEVFGLKAGPDMAAAIREGRFAYEDYAFAIAFGGETIQTAADDTDDWREKLQLLKNKGLVLLEPVAAKVFGGITTAITWVAAAVELFISTWKNAEDGVTQSGINGAIQKVALFVKDAVDVIVPKLQELWTWFVTNLPGALSTLGGFLTDVFEGGKKLLTDLADAFGTNEGTILKVLGGIALGLTAVAIAWNAGPGLIVTAIVALVAGLLWAYENVDWFRQGAQTAFSLVKTAFDEVTNAAVWLWGVIQNVWDKTEGFRAFVADVFVKQLTALKKEWDVVSTAVGVVANVMQTLWDKSEGLRKFFVDGFKKGLEGAATTIGALATVFDGVISKIKDVISYAKTAVDWVGKIGSFGGGGVLNPVGILKGLIPGFAYGGDVNAGQIVRVGERGRSELFVPSTAGTIVPHDAMGGGGNLTIVVNGSVVTERQLIDVVHEGLLRKQRAGALGLN